MAVARLLAIFIATYGFSFLGPFTLPASAARNGCGSPRCVVASAHEAACDADNAATDCQQKLVVARPEAGSDTRTDDDAAVPALMIGLALLAILISLTEYFLSARRREKRPRSTTKTRS